MIAVDVMGGDRAPHAIIEGAVCAARTGIPVLLCGRKDDLFSCLPGDWDKLPISLEFCDEQIFMDEEPGRAVRKKANSSLVCAMKAVACGRAAAFFSAGNSGAVLVASVVFAGRVKGIARPAVGAFLPTQTSSFLCLDVGANVDCKPEYLYQFALMGHAYVQVAKQIEHPRIALLSNGHEPYKGSFAVKSVYGRLVQSNLRFVGNIEARELSKDDIVDVVVCDGFVGNVLLKSIQGTASSFFSWLQAEAADSWFNAFLLWLTKGIFKKMKKRLDYASTGGALLLGVKHPVIFAHGRSDARAIANGIAFAHKVVQEKTVSLCNEKLLELLGTSATFTGAMKRKVRSILHWRQQSLS